MLQVEEPPGILPGRPAGPGLDGPSILAKHRKLHGNYVGAQGPVPTPLASWAGGSYRGVFTQLAE